MRKNLLASITAADPAPATKENRAEYANRGASRSMQRSIDEMAESAKLLIAGETIVSLDPGLLDESFVADRLQQDEQGYLELREAIRAQGQLTPILVRPHPTQSGRYMIVFGHRRARAAKDLKIQVRAVVRELADIAHIVAQGQENSARANLSFIEKALFAKKLLAMGQTKDTIKAALTIDDTLLSRMSSVTDIIATPVIEAIGTAKSVGRDRWEDLKKLLAHPKNAALADEIIASPDFLQLSGAERFNHLAQQVKAARRPIRKPTRSEGAGDWVAPDRAVKASYRNQGKSFSLSLSSKDSGDFGRYITSNLEKLYRAFREENPATRSGE